VSERSPERTEDAPRSGAAPTQEVRPLDHDRAPRSEDAPGEAGPVDLEGAVPDPGAPAPPGAEDPEAAEPTLESILGDLEAMIAQRDEYLSLAQEKQAEFENYKKRVMKQQAEHLRQAAADLVDKLLPVLDACDAGIHHGDTSIAPVRAQLLGVLEKEGLARLDPTGSPFDPTEHEAVTHEPGEPGAEGADGPVVTETLRAGYRWQGRLLRPAMVRVKG
jgi:molecular chaperone GrpE